MISSTMRSPCFSFTSSSFSFDRSQVSGASGHYCAHAKILRHSSRCSHERKPKAFPVMSSPKEPKISVVEIGMGIDLHGQNATVAATRACRSTY